MPGKKYRVRSKGGGKRGKGKSAAKKRVKTAATKTAKKRYGY